MPSDLIVNQNTYASRAQADTALDDAIGKGGWAFVSPDDKDRALLTAAAAFNAESWSGAPTPVDVLGSAAVAAGGAGYAVGDTLTLVGGTLGEAAQVEVTGETGGVVDAIKVVNAGSYLDTPADPIATTGGSGTGATLNGVFISQPQAHPRTGMVDLDGQPIPDDVVVQDVIDAQILYAYELSQNPELANQTSTGSNDKRLKAGSAEIEFFRPTDGTRFPDPVQKLLAHLLGGGGVSAPFASGTDDQSTFEDGPPSLTEGYP